MATAQTVPQVERTVAKPGRVASVDVLRGLTVALMILVNDPGDWDHVFGPLDHATWNGWTLTDMVFPTFLFVMGMSMVFSMEARRARGNCKATLTGHVFARAAKIEALGLALAFYAGAHWTRLRFYGVLPRIALCYLLAGLLLVATLRVRVLVSVVAILLVGYWVLLRWVPVPGAGVPGRDMPLFDKTMNLASWIDRGVVGWTQHWLHTGRLYKRVRDPEGLLSTLPAVATTLLGALAGLWMRRARGRTMLLGLALAGITGVAAGEAWSVWFPINKNLWTSSYVLLTAGWALLAVALFSWLMDDRKQPRWVRVAAWPWLVFGSNAITAFTVSEFIVDTMLHLKRTDADGYTHTLWATVYETVFARNGSTEWTSLAFAACFVAVCFLPNWWLWRKKIFVRI